jgi:hypothetical protein
MQDQCDEESSAPAETQVQSAAGESRTMDEIVIDMAQHGRINRPCCSMVGGI